MVELTPIEDEFGEESESFNFDSPEDVLIEIVGEQVEGAAPGSWDGYSIESCTIINCVNEDVSGAASYEKSYGGFLDYTVMDLVECPQKEGWYVVEKVTGYYSRGDGWSTDDNLGNYILDSRNEVSYLLIGGAAPERIRRKPMFEIIAFNTRQATAETEAEAELKRAKFQQAIDDSYRGPGPATVTIQRKDG